MNSGTAPRTARARIDPHHIRRLGRRFS
jgi:hypothetical protein